MGTCREVLREVRGVTFCTKDLRVLGRSCLGETFGIYLPPVPCLLALQKEVEGEELQPPSGAPWAQVAPGCPWQHAVRACSWGRSSVIHLLCAEGYGGPGPACLPWPHCSLLGRSKPRTPPVICRRTSAGVWRSHPQHTCGRARLSDQPVLSSHFLTKGVIRRRKANKSPHLGYITGHGQSWRAR